MSLRAFNNYIDMYLKEHLLPNKQSLISCIESAKTSTTGIVEPLTSAKILKASDNIMVMLHPTEANDLVSTHCHDFFELIYLSRGSCTQNINGISRNLKEGDLCLLNPQSKHAIATDSEDALLFNILINRSLFQESFLCLIAENDLISNFFLTSLFKESEEQHFLYFPRNESSNSGPLIQSLIREFYEKHFGYQKSMECYLALLFNELIRFQKKRIDEDTFEIMGNNPLSEILIYMNVHKYNVTLQSVAKEFHYHPNYLSTLIKKYTNKSFSEIIQEAKLQEVCYYLTKTDIPIEEIGHIMGYYDRSYFNRVFKKHFQMTPGEYRKFKSEISPKA